MESTQSILGQIGNKRECSVCGKSWIKNKAGLLQPDCECTMREVEQKEPIKINDEAIELRKAELPERMINFNFESYPGNSDKVSKVKKFIADNAGTILVMVGNLGGGKSGLAAAGMREFITRHKKTAKYSFAYDILTDALTNMETRKATLTECLKYNFLIIDEVGVQIKSEPARNFLERVLIGRYENLKSTILISNCPTETEFYNLVGERVKNRVESNGTVLVFDGQNLRGKNNQK